VPIFIGRGAPFWNTPSPSNADYLTLSVKASVRQKHVTCQTLRITFGWTEGGDVDVDLDDHH
jgi:hypothetical protein